MERQYEMKDIFFELMDYHIGGVDTYFCKGSRWLIFTDEKKWVIELTKEGTLWYNYYFFEKAMKLLSLDVVENQHYITEWVENFIQNGVKHTDWCQIGISTSIEEAIQNGVKETKHNPFEDGLAMEEAIQNGVKETERVYAVFASQVENTIQNGVKNTQAGNGFIDFEVEDTIQNGVKEIKEVSDDSLWNEFFKVKCKQTIRDGVKRTELGGKDRKIDEIKEIVENGVKETTPGGYLGSVEMRDKTVHIFEPAKQLHYLEDVINDGIKEVKELPDKSGMLLGYGEYYARREDKTYPHTDIVNKVIRDGIKETKYCELHSLMRADHIIEDGVKLTFSNIPQK